MAFDSLIAAASLLASVVSLIVAIIALRISNRAYIFSSKDYIPEIDLDIDTDADRVTIVNKSGKLFKIEIVHFAKIELNGFEWSDETYQFPFITQSKSYVLYEKEKKIIIDKHSPGPCAYRILSLQ